MLDDSSFPDVGKLDPGFCQRIKRQRKSLGLSQEDVARRIGISTKNFGYIERGWVKDPHYSTLSGIASALGLSIAELVGENGDYGVNGENVPVSPKGTLPAKHPQAYWAKVFASRWSDRELLRFIDKLWDEYFEKVGL